MDHPMSPTAAGTGPTRHNTPTPRRSAHASLSGSPSLLLGERIKATSLRVLMVNDVYSHRPQDGTGGWAELGSMLEAQRASSTAAKTIFVVPGDFLGGSTLAESFKGANVVDVLRALQTDYVCLGNHEFDFGDSVLCDYMRASPFPWLGANVRQASRGGALMEGATDICHFDLPVQRCTVNGAEVPLADDAARPIRVGLFGVCTAATPSLSHPSPDVVFGSPDEAALEAVARLRSEAAADFVIGLTHLRTAEDLALAGKLDGVTALLGGHDHTAFATYEHDTLVFKCGMNAEFLGVIDLELRVVEAFDPDTGRVVRSTPQSHCSFSMVQNRHWSPAPAVLAVLESYEAKLRAQIAASGGAEVLLTLSSQTEWDSRSDVVRRREAVFPSVIADAMAAVGRADAGVINGGFVRGNKRYPRSAGISVGDIRFELPFPKTLQVITIAGASFRRAMEQMLALVPAATGAYPHLSSRLRMRYDSTAAEGARVREIYLDGAPLMDDDVFTVSVTSFMFAGGDGVAAWSEGIALPPSEHTAAEVLIADAVIEYLKSAGGKVRFQAEERRVVDLAAAEFDRS